MSCLPWMFVVLSVFKVTQSQLPNMDYCPPEDPNCHPWCIEYVDKCRLCRCKNDKHSSGGSGFNLGASNTDGSGFGGGGSTGGDSWSSLENKWGSSGGDLGGAKGNGGKTNIIIIEKEKEARPGMMSFPGSSFAGKSPFQMSAGPRPSMMMFPPRRNSIPPGCKTKNVPLVSPGVPRYCVTGFIVDCPHDCVVTDEFGCKSCPCAPATKAWMPVCENAPEVRPHSTSHNSCIGTKLCIMSCDGEAKIGETGSDGCQRCTCIKKEKNHVPLTVTTTPKPTTKSVSECTKLIACMIRCKDTGYVIGDTQKDGCPSCQCKKKSANNSNNSSNNNNNNGKNNNNNGKNNNFGTGGGMQTWSVGNSGSGTSAGSGSSIISNVGGHGTGSGGGSKCEFPLCMNGGSGGGNPLMPSSGSSGSSRGGCAGPFCASMTGGGGSGGMMAGGGGGGMMMGGGGGAGSGGSGPFKASLSSAASASGGMGSAMKSPFMAAAGASTGGGADGGTDSGSPKHSEVEKEAYNTECFGPSCSAKNGKMHGLIGSCMDMERCIANCGGSYEIGPLGSDGCQSCTCNPE
uniref:Antistasin-like domain-containing protein n=1 Tax=Magallana gigas TaxID=29159 RepID=A0A8W8NXR1_MAGGI|nr:uncharacterized protein LOC105342490 isoform X2 [Crassostrea gigas]